MSPWIWVSIAGVLALMACVLGGYAWGRRRESERNALARVEAERRAATRAAESRAQVEASRAEIESKKRETLARKPTADELSDLIRRSKK